MPGQKQALKGHLWSGDCASVAWFVPQWLFTLEMQAPKLDRWPMRLEQLGQ